MGATTGKAGRPIKFGLDIRQAAFGIWFKNGRSWRGLTEQLKESLNLEIAPSPRTVRVWAQTDAWEQHADALEGQMEHVGDREIIRQRQALISQMATVGQDLVDWGMDYIKSTPADNAADAIRAVGRGTELLDKQLGWAAYFAELATADEAKLDRELRKFMTGDVVDATPVDKEEDGTKESADTE